jgi:hypothetical protein
MTTPLHSCCLPLTLLFLLLWPMFVTHRLLIRWHRCKWCCQVRQGRRMQVLRRWRVWGWRRQVRHRWRLPLLLPLGDVNFRSCQQHDQQQRQQQLPTGAVGLQESVLAALKVNGWPLALGRASLLVFGAVPSRSGGSACACSLQPAQIQGGAHRGCVQLSAGPGSCCVCLWWHSTSAARL